jgi:acetate kinase
MKILSVNAGSSSLKFQMYEMPEEKVLISGTFERIGIEGGMYTIKLNGEKIKKEKDLADHSVAVQTLIDELLENKVIESLDEIKGVGHRLVHGGEKYASSVVINDDVIKTVEELSDLAPLHNPANLIGVRTFI